MNREIQEELFSKLTLSDDDAKPLAGTDITGRNQHQYTRLALVRLPSGSYQSGPVSKDRFFVIFAESSWLFNELHTRLGTPAWIRDGFDNKYIYIEEVLHRPRTGETLNEYTTYIPQAENDLWLSIFNFVTKTGIIERSAHKLVSKTYRLPQ
jgi:hypothetical protein